VLAQIRTPDRPVVVSCADAFGNLSWMLFPEGRSSELRLRRGVGQAAYARNNHQVECTGVLLCVIRESLQLQLNCIGDKSRQRGSSLPLTLTDRPASFSVAQLLFEIHSRLQPEHKATTVTDFNSHMARAINIYKRNRRKLYSSRAWSAYREMEV